ncbi:MAG: hypothetical protein PHD65_12000 [Gallionella sp.]|nr:hypothetical protein [Gallionella sp.]
MIKGLAITPPVKAAINMYMASGKIIPSELLRESQCGIVTTDELRQFMESIILGFANSQSS